MYYSDLTSDKINNSLEKIKGVIFLLYSFSLVVAAAEKEDRNKDDPQATVIVIKETLNTHSVIHLTRWFQYILCQFGK